jgi:hypothetical protein
MQALQPVAGARVAEQVFQLAALSTQVAGHAHAEASAGGHVGQSHLGTRQGRARLNAGEGGVCRHAPMVPPGALMRRIQMD